MVLTKFRIILISVTEFIADAVSGSGGSVSSSSGGGMTEWSAWGIVVLLMMAILLYEGQRKTREKEFIKGYKNYDDALATTHKKNKKSGLKLFGEYLGEFYNEERRCYEMRFRSGLSHYFNVFSNDPMAEYKEVHFLERNYWVYYSINAQLYKKLLKPKDYYERKIGYTLQAYIYKAVCFCVNTTVSGLLISSILFGSLFAIWFPDIMGLNFLLGCLFGIGLCIANYTILNHTTAARDLLKLKVEIIKEEYYLTALEAPEKVVNIYKVWGFERFEIKTSDEAKALSTKKLVGKKEIIYHDVKGGKKNIKTNINYKKPNTNYKKTNLNYMNLTFIIKDLKEDDNVDYIIVKGYDNLFDMIQNPHVEVESFEFVGQEKMRKTRQEIRDLRHGYLERNKQFAERIFRLQKENARGQREYISVREQLHTVEETMDVEIRKLGIRMLKTQEKSRKTLRDIFEDVAGDIVGKQWDQKLESVLRKIEFEKQMAQTEKLSLLIQAIEQLISKVGQKSNVDMTEVLERLKLVPSEEGVEEVV